MKKTVYLTWIKTTCTAYGTRTISKGNRTDLPRYGRT